jgi:outer membrane immunogenic protein
MKKTLLAMAAIVGMGGVAAAADLPAKVIAPAMVRPACSNFGGWYIGGHGDVIANNWDWNDRNAWASNEVSNALPLSVSSRETGFGGGVQAGWNYQRGCTMWGLEADWTWTGLNSEKTNTDGQAGNAIDTLRVSSELKWYGTLRARAGVVVDNVLIYVTGGGIFADVNYSFGVTDFFAAGFVTEAFSSSKTRWGWTIGGGAEWQFLNNWTVKGEMLYASFEDVSETFNSTFAVNNGNPASKQFDFANTLWIGRIGLNYRF